MAAPGAPTGSWLDSSPKGTLRPCLRVMMSLDHTLRNIFLRETCICKTQTLPLGSLESSELAATVLYF